jgi:tetratricopeptide (TPR) repeat protein
MTAQDLRARRRRGWRVAVLAAAALTLVAVAVLELWSPTVGWLHTPRRFVVMSLHWVKVHWLTSSGLSVIVALVGVIVALERRREARKAARESDPDETVARAKPHQLPADTKVFTGRDPELSRLRSLLGGRQTAPPGTAVIAAIEGIGGTGKSALAIHAGHQLSEEFPDGQLYVNLHGTTLGLEPVKPLEALGGFLRALGWPSDDVPRQLEEAAVLYRSLLLDRRILVLLDNAHSVAQIRPLLPASPTCAVLITSRMQLTVLDDVERVPLGALSPNEATQLLDKIAGSDRIGADPAAAAEIAAACSHLPLALRIAAGRLDARRAWTLRDLANRLADQRSRLSQLQLGDLAVRASFQVSYQTLPPNLARSFRLLGLPEGPSIGVPAAAALLNQTMAEVEKLLEQLVDLNLLENPIAGRYRLHDLLRLFAHEQAISDEPEAERTMALHRMLSIYLVTTQRADQRIRPGRPSHGELATNPQQDGFKDMGEALRWLELERTTLVNAVQQAAAMPSCWGIAGELADALRGFFELRSYFADWEQTGEAALTAAGQQHDDRALATARLNLGIVALQRHRLDKAMRLLDEALHGYRNVADQLGQARALTSIGNLYRMRDEYDLAVPILEEALGLRRVEGDRHGEAVTLHILGLVAVEQGNHEYGMACFEQSLDLFGELGDRWGEASDRWGQANAWRHLDKTHPRHARHAEAINAFKQTLKLSRELGHRGREAESLTQLGLLYQELGRYQQAVDHLQGALTIRRSVDDHYGIATTLRYLGHVLQANGKHRQARMHWQDAIAWFERAEAQREAADVRALATQSGTLAKGSQPPTRT